MSGLRWLCQWMVLAVGVGLIGGCSNPSSPGVEPEITNATDNFQYQVTDIRGYTHESTYSWQNTGASANVNQAATITHGSAMLILVDGDGAIVYSRSLADNGTFVSAAGVPGLWTIRVNYSDASGTVNFRVQRKT